jgi:hypothetical protein
VAVETIPLLDLADLFEERRWGYRVAGRGDYIVEAYKKDGWYYRDTTVDCPMLHPKAVERAFAIQERGIPVEQWIYASEDWPFPKPAQPKREVGIDWEAIAKGIAIVAGGFIFLAIAGMMTAASNEISKPQVIEVPRERPRVTSALWCGDPALLCMLADQDYTSHGMSTIVEVYRWF